MKTYTANGFTVTQDGLTVSIKPGTMVLCIGGKEVRNGECEFIVLDSRESNYNFDRLCKYADAKGSLYTLKGLTTV